MDKEEMILREYQIYSEQKENFIERNFRTNRFYMAAIVVLIFSMIYTGNVIFLHKITATLVFAFFGVATSVLWWMNVDSYNTLIKIKYSKVIEVIEEKLPVQPFSDEYKGIEEFRKNKIFMFSDIQKMIAIVFALFFFAVCVSELTPLIVIIADRIKEMF